jgi:hypothetical protein
MLIIDEMIKVLQKYIMFDTRETYINIKYMIIP